MAATRGGFAAAAGCVLVAGFALLSVAPSLAQGANPNASANPNAQATPDMNAEESADNLAAAPEETRPYFLGATASLGEYYDSNASATLKPRSDATTQGELDLNAHDRTARFQGDIAYSLYGNYHASLHGLDSVQNYLNAIGRAELWVDHLFFTARAFAWPTFISRLGSLDAGNGTSATANNRNAYGYSAAPDLSFRFDDYAQSDLTVTESGEYFSSLSNSSQGFVVLLSGTPANVQSTTINEKITGGQEFGRLEWVVNATGTNSNQQGFHQLQRVGEADMEYHFNHTFGFIANLGYRHYRSRPALARGISGVIAMGGFSFRPEENFSMIFKAGRQYNFTSFTGNARYQISGTSSVLATLDDVVTTPQDLLLGGLQTLGVTQVGIFVPPGSTLPNEPQLPDLPVAQPQPVSVTPFGQLSLDNLVSRYRTATVGLTHKMPRTVLSLTLFGTIRDLLPTVGLVLPASRQTVYGTDLIASYDLTRDIAARVNADYSIAHEFGGVDKILTIGADVEYKLSPVWSAYARASYLDRNARVSFAFANGTLSDAQIGAGLRYSF